jgi:DNA-binding winged helix-turn-helix (wHTH) protein
VRLNQGRHQKPEILQVCLRTRTDATTYLAPTGIPVKLRFGDVYFDSDRRQVWCGAEEVRLTTKAFELLKLLLERRPDAVAKSEILERLWPNTFVSEASLHGLIAEIRDAVRDDARSQRCIRTVHGFGYAFAGTAVDPSERRPAPRQYWLLWDGGRLALPEGETVIGREGEGVTVLDSPTVSRQHARIVIDDREAAIEDLGSKNGTYVRGERIGSRVRLEDGDQIRIGSIQLTFQTVAPAASTRTQSASPPDAASTTPPSDRRT